MFFGKPSFRPGKSFLRSDAARHARGSGYRTHPDDDDDLARRAPPRQSVKGKATFFFGARSGRRGPAPKKDETPEQLRARSRRRGRPTRPRGDEQPRRGREHGHRLHAQAAEMEGSKYEVGVLGDWKAGDKQFYLKPLYILNSLFNLIFAIDIVVCFFTGYVHHAAPATATTRVAIKSSTRLQCDDPMEGKVVREFQRIAEHYLKGGFSFDLVVTIPWDEIFEATQSGGSNDAMKFVRVLRLVRLARLFKFKFKNKYQEKLGAYYAIPIAYYPRGPLHQGSESCQLPEENEPCDDWDAPPFSCKRCRYNSWFDGLQDTLGKRNQGKVATRADRLPRDVDVDGFDARASAARRPREREHTRSVRTSPESTRPSSSVSTHRSLRAQVTNMEKYSAAVYWAMYTLTSVGYGDISATNTTEMQVCTICLLIGSFMWAYIIGSACSILTSISLEKAEHQQTMDHLNNFLKAKNMPLDFRIELRSFFTQRNILQVSARAGASGAMSPAVWKSNLQPDFNAVHRRSAWLFNVCYLKDANILLITKIESQLSGQIYPPLEQVEWEDSLTTVSQGLAARRGKIYRKGCYWGEDFILASPNLKNRRPVNTLTYVELLSLPRDRFFALLQDFPEQYARRFLLYGGIRYIASLARSGDYAGLAKLRLPGYEMPNMSSKPKYDKSPKRSAAVAPVAPDEGPRNTKHRGAFFSGDVPHASRSERKEEDRDPRPAALEARDVRETLSPRAQAEDDAIVPDAKRSHAEDVLSFQEISHLNDRKVSLKDSHFGYLQQHPELRSILADFTAAALLEKPMKIFPFAAEHFAGLAQSPESGPPMLVGAARRATRAGKGAR
ncbi:voltage-gated potassium channel [Aureococcus anophagefferens]|nr:voltage-gated potassium channel [Aureococcus anophagefferens]